MPTMANVTVKKNDGTTDIIWTAVQPSSGDGVPAIWRQEVASMHTAGKPTLALSSKYNGNRSARRLTAEFRHPQTFTNTTTGIVGVENILPISVSVSVPVSFPQTLIDEAISQSFNLLVSTLVKDCFKTGFSAT